MRKWKIYYLDIYIYKNVCTFTKMFWSPSKICRYKNWLKKKPKNKKIKKIDVYYVQGEISPRCRHNIYIWSISLQRDVKGKNTEGNLAVSCFRAQQNWQHQNVEIRLSQTSFFSKWCKIGQSGISSAKEGLLDETGC